MGDGCLNNGVSEVMAGGCLTCHPILAFSRQRGKEQMTEWLAVRNNNVSILFRTPSTRFQAAFIGKQVSNIGSLKPIRQPETACALPCST